MPKVKTMTKQNIEKCKHICGTIMETIVLSDRPENLTYCPKCTSQEELDIAKCHSPKVELDDINCDFCHKDRGQLFQICLKCFRELESKVPKVELPEIEDKLFELIKDHTFLDDCRLVGCDRWDKIHQLLSHSTTQLVEKIKGECEKRKSGYLQRILYKMENKSEWNEGYDKAIDDLLEIISKYK